MRVTQPIEARGFFWRPDAQSTKVPGTLFIKDGGEIRLEILGLLDDAANVFGAPDAKIPRIVGEIEKYGFVTLDHCFYTDKTLSLPTPSTNRIHVSRAFLKVAYDAAEAVSFTSFYFSVESLDEWHAITGIQVDYDSPSRRSVTVRFSPPEEVELWHGDGVRIRVRFSWALPSMPALQAAAITQKSYLHVEYDQPTVLEEFAKLAHKLVHFFSLAADKVVAIRDLTGTSPSLVREIAPGNQREIDIPIYYQSLSFSEIAPKVSKFEMLFQLTDLGENRQVAITRWLDTHEKIGPGMNLFFSAVGDEHKYLNSRFLLLAQALETYHRRTTEETEMTDTEFRLLRWVVVDSTAEAYRTFIKGKLAHANEVSLGTRLKRLLGRFPKYFGTDDEKQRLVQSIVRTRNYFTHYDPELKEKAADGIDLWTLCASMEALFRLILMTDMGFSEEGISKAVTKNYRLKRATRMT